MHCTALLADALTVAPGTRLAHVCIGQRGRIGHKCNLANSVIWADCFVGNESSFFSATVCNRNRIGHNVQLNDRVIVSDDCVIGDSVKVKANIKIWPGKQVDDGAIVSSSVVWGDKWNRELFTDSKITGLALTEITPEMAVRVGSALWAFRGLVSRVLTGRDTECHA